MRKNKHKTYVRAQQNLFLTYSLNILFDHFLELSFEVDSRKWSKLGFEIEMPY